MVDLDRPFMMAWLGASGFGRVRDDFDSWFEVHVFYECRSFDVCCDVHLD